MRVGGGILIVIPRVPLNSMLALLKDMGVDSFNVDPTSKGWRVYGLSPSRIMLAEMRMDWADLGNPPDLERVGFTADVDVLTSAVKAVVPAGEAVSFDLGGSTLTVVYKGVSCVVPLLAPLGSRGKVPEVELTSAARVPVADLATFVRASSANSRTDRAGIAIGEDSVRLTSYEGHTKVASLVADDAEDILVPEDGGESQTYPMMGVRTLLKGLTGVEKVDLSFGSCLPLRAHWADAHWTIDWLVAPQIEEDDA